MFANILAMVTSGTVNTSDHPIYRSITRACSTLDVLDQKVSDAVNVRQELDLRIGKAFVS